MIPNQWYVVLESRQIRRRPVGVVRMGQRLVFWRDRNGEVRCLEDSCVHRGAALSRGKVGADGHIECPFHGLRYDGTGKVTLIPANGRAAPIPDRFRGTALPTYEAHGFIWVWWGDRLPPDATVPRFFTEIGSDMRYATVYDRWKAHYSRVIENQLDVAHLPFVHHNTIGRGGRTLVEGPGVQWLGDDAFRVYVYNKTDDGSAPRRPDEVPVPRPDRDFHLEFIYPNLWQNYISKSFRVVAAFVPVDEANTLLYLRLYQRMVTVPVLGGLCSAIAAPFNLIVAHQDRRVVETQTPKASGVGIGERLFQADRPIAEYRRRRQALIDAAEAKAPGPPG